MNPPKKVTDEETLRKLEERYPEKLLYKPIEDVFVKKGYLAISARKKLPKERVHSPFGVKIHGVAKKVDVVAFKWKNDQEIEAKAVECKLGSTWKAAGAAIGQATAYQRVFPEVYVATEANEGDLKHVESLLRQLGIGYIMVKHNNAEEIFPPGQNVRFNMKEFRSQVKRRATLFLAWEEVFGKQNIQVGNADKPYETWVSTREVCSIYAFLEKDSLTLGFNIEQKDAVKGVFSAVNGVDLHNVLSRLPSEYKIYLAQITRYYPVKKIGREKSREVSTLTEETIKNYIKLVKEWEYQAQLQVKKIRTDVRELPRQTAVREMMKIKTELCPLVDLFRARC